MESKDQFKKLAAVTVLFVLNIFTEYRVPLSAEEALKYAHADKRAKFRIAAENQRKKEFV